MLKHLATYLLAAVVLSSNGFSFADQSDEDWWNDVQLSQAVTGQSVPTPATKQDLLCAKVKLGMDKAELIAQKRVCGKTKEIELERSDDGKLTYEVTIENAAKQKIEITLDAVSGVILSVEPEVTEPPAQPKP